MWTPPLEMWFSASVRQLRTQGPSWAKTPCGTIIVGGVDNGTECRAVDASQGGSFFDGVGVPKPMSYMGCMCSAGWGTQRSDIATVNKKVGRRNGPQGYIERSENLCMVDTQEGNMTKCALGVCLLKSATQMEARSLDATKGWGCWMSLLVIPKFSLTLECEHMIDGSETSNFLSPISTKHPHPHTSAKLTQLSGYPSKIPPFSFPSASRGPGHW